MRFPKKLLSGFVLFLLLLILVLLSGITVPLDFLDHRLELLASDLLDRKVTIQGPFRLTTSLRPSLQFDGLTIANPAGWSQENKQFLTVEHAQAQISLTDLVRGDIRLLDIEFSGVDLHLISKTDQTNNYRFGTSASEPETKQKSHELTGLDLLSLKDMRLSYLDEHSGKEYTLAIDEAHGHDMKSSQLQFALRGKISGLACTLNITGDSLYELLYGKHSWPLSQGKLNIADTILDVSGILVRAQNGIDKHLAFMINGPDLDVITQLFDVRLPDTGEISLAGQISTSPGEFQFSNLHLAALNSSLQGDLVLSLQGTRSTLAGTLTSPHIDQALFSAFTGDASPENVKEHQTRQQSSQLPWDTLRVIDTDLHLDVAEIQFNRFYASDIKADVSLLDGDLVLPFSLVAMDIPVEAQADISSSKSTPTIELTINSKSAELDPLLEALSISKQFSSKLGALSLIAKSRGKTIEELKDALDVDVTIGATTFLTDSGINISSQNISLQRRAGQSAVLSGKGDALGSPFSIEAKAFPHSLRLHACDTNLLVHATLLEDHSAEFDFSINGKNLCGMLEPVTQMIGKELDFSTKGTGSISNDAWSVNLETITLDTLLFDATVEQKKSDQGKPQITASIHSREIDLRPYLGQSPGDVPAQDQNKEPKPDNDKKQEPAVAAKNQDKEAPTAEDVLKERTDTFDTMLAQWLPQKSLCPVDGNIELRVDTLETGRGTASDILLSAIFEDGRLSDAPFHVSIVQQLLSGNVKIDLISEDPTIQFKIGAKMLDLPALYKEFGLGKAQDLQAESIQLDISLKGKTLEDVMKKSSQELTIKGGTYRIDKEFGDDLVINLQELTASNVSGQKTKLSISGDINAEPLSVTMEENGLLQADTLKPIVGTVMVAIGDSKLFFDGTIDRKKNNINNTVNCVYSLSGKRMDSLNWLIGVNLPPLGPYTADGSFYAKNGTWYFNDIAIQIGDSKLLGQMTLTGTKTEDNTFDFPVNWDTTLQAKRIQLNDFQFDGWSPVAEEKKEEKEAKEIDETLEEKNAQSEGTLHDLLSPELAGKFTGSVKIQVDEVLSGTDRLGSGKLSANLNNGRYSLDKLKLNIPGGEVVIEGSLKPETNRNIAHLSMQIENLDYGVLARRTNPDSDLKGTLNVNFDLHSEADTLVQLKEHMGGTFRFGVLPEEYKAGAIDLWAVNIVTAALPALLKGTPSKANCLAGKFLLDDGIMQPELFLLDTSKMRVHGKGKVSFKTDVIDFHLNPTPKAAHFFSFATPVTVSGTIFDYKIGVTTEAVFETVFGLATSVVTVPFQWLFTDNLEEDGKTACAEAMTWVTEEETDTIH